MIPMRVSPRSSTLAFGFLSLPKLRRIGETVSATRRINAIAIDERMPTERIGLSITDRNESNATMVVRPENSTDQPVSRMA